MIQSKLIEIYTLLEKEDKISGIVNKIYKNKIDLPYFSDVYENIEDYYYAFPPCFIPVFSEGDGPSYMGVVKHFFIERKTTFVEYDLSTESMIEIARNDKQLATDILIQSMLFNEDEIDTDIRDLAINLGINIDLEITKTYNDQFNGFSTETYKYFSAFENETPLSYTSLLRYDGDFPNEKKLENATELESEFQNFKGTKLDLFNGFFELNDFGNAWLVLNSKNWNYNDIVKCLNKLKSVSKSDLFILIADTWIENHTDKGDEYFY